MGKGVEWRAEAVESGELVRQPSNTSVPKSIFSMQRINNESAKDTPRRSHRSLFWGGKAKLDSKSRTRHADCL
jgi:hypothetical protein